MRLALGELVDELVEVADLPHRRFLDLLDANPQTTPVISVAGFIAGASAKNVSKSASLELRVELAGP